jgi:hypothetical protein
LKKRIIGLLLHHHIFCCRLQQTSDLISREPCRFADLWHSLNNEIRRDQSCGSVDLSNQDQSNNVCILAKALVFARTGQASYRSGTVSALQSIVNMGTYSGRALALGRELGAYVVAADLIDLKNYDPVLDSKFRAKIKSR